jgi:N-acetylglucosaminyl-diphospho-decaprenol L-rhamnosyltransferase
LKARLAIVIVSYNTVALLRQCLSSLRASLTRSDLSPIIVVVDNGSLDGSASMVATAFPDVQLHAQAENRGFASANNVAINDIEADYTLFLNPDTEVLGDAPLALVRFLENHSDVGLGGGRLLNPDLSFQDSAFRFPSLAMSFLDFFPINYRLTRSRMNGRYPRNWYGRSFDIDHPLGACMCVRADIIQQIGGFDEGFFMYCEEVDWCMRIKQSGWRIAYTPDAEIIHHVGASSRQNAGPMLVQLHRSRDRLFQKHYGPAYALAARQIVRLGMRSAAARARADLLTRRINEEELTRRLAIYRDVVTWGPLT